ncbi:MAG TPA: hypothetical protein VNU94_02500 [Acidobacteriaceae bacterium]|jgi:hypothetical protein|nr:hypothetical protein [Acidobacteriaceae bacterium]
MAPLNKQAKAEERLEIAKKLGRLGLVDEVNQSPKNYYSLDIGTGKNKNAAIIYKSSQRVSFFIEKPSLVEQLKVWFSVKALPDDPKRLYNKSKHHIQPLTMSDIEDPERRVLIEEVLKHSLDVIKKRKTKVR